MLDVSLGVRENADDRMSRAMGTKGAGMAVFDEYAKHYDLFYRDKDYAGEALYVDRIIRKRLPGACTMLELGCGTGKYVHAFTGLGYSVVGIDRSPAMIAEAEKRFGGPMMPPAKPRFSVGDVRSYREESHFDVVVSLFHVMSYQTANSDLVETFQTAGAHLDSGGLFVFDCWYGPGVLTDPPRNPIKTVESDSVLAERRTTATLLPDRNLVTVHFDVQLTDKETGEATTLAEDHAMRYLFVPEVQDLAERTGLRLLSAYRWLSEDPPGVDAWYALFVLQTAN
jgi:SAM-dependent methyltransferase